MRLDAMCGLVSFGLILAAGAQQPAGSIDVPAGARVVLEARGEGVQIYACKDTGGSIAWVLTGPEARLLDGAGKQIGKHLAGPRWELTDGSAVQGVLMASRPSPETGSVAWLLLRAKPGTATGKMSEVAFIRRTETHGGAADPSGCRDAGDVGRTTRVAYDAHYAFYAAK
ncbi:MAG TPA: DUF3455 domain-containing protein [Acidobacteriaceae bacterium]|jgi:hypothetical protein